MNVRIQKMKASVWGYLTRRISRCSFYISL